MAVTGSLAYISQANWDEQSINFTLRVTARCAFVILILVFITRPTHQLLRNATTARLLSHRRQLGIAFAGVHIAHLGIVLVKVQSIPDFSIQSNNILGLLTYGVILAMLVTSYQAPARALGPKRWRILHTLGLYWLFIAFAQREILVPMLQPVSAQWWLVTLVAIAVTVRAIAFFSSRARRQLR